MEARPELRVKLQENAARLHAGLKAAGLQTGEHVSPVVAVTLETIPQAVGFWNALLENGVYVNLSLPPATPDNRPLLRCSVMAAHSAEEIDKAAAVFKAVAEHFQA